MPVLTVIAGPNGAGKSTHSKELLTHLGIEAFDLDKEFYSIWTQFDFDLSLEQSAYDRAQQLYGERRSSALKEKKNFAFETNYHTKDIFTVLDLFRSSAYQVELVFICLESPEMAIERVKDRVAKGGHSVDENTIRERFRNGLTLLDSSYHQFDTVSIYVSKLKNVEPVLILEPQQKQVTFLADIPASLKIQLPQITQFADGHKY